MPIPRPFLLCGHSPCDASRPALNGLPSISLRAGPVTLVFDKGDLRYIRFAGREVIRRIYVAVRDASWGTIPQELLAWKLETLEDGFLVTFSARHSADGIEFNWQGEIRGGADGSVAFQMDGEAGSDFRSNRIGICILHPLDNCVGKAVRVLHSEGALESSMFPVEISPHQPFKDIRSISHEAFPGCWIKLDFFGAVFEMEDQRNWMDASFKTYCPPLDLPKPVRVKRGDRYSQRIALTLEGRDSISDMSAQTFRFALISGGRGNVKTLPYIPPRSPMPRIGFGMASHGMPLSFREAERLRSLQPFSLRVVLPLSEEEWEEWMRKASDEANALGTVLEVAVHLTERREEELSALAGLLENWKPEKPAIGRWLVFSLNSACTLDEDMNAALRILRPLYPDSLFGGGSKGHFVDLNRTRPRLPGADFVAYGISPQVHAYDDLSLVESPASLPWTVHTAGSFAPDLPPVIHAVSLLPEAYPAPSGEGNRRNADAPSAEADSRQMSLLGAAWTMATLKNLGESGVESVCFYETTGYLGLMHPEAASAGPEAFPTRPGMVYPIYHIMADLAEFQGGEMRSSLSSAPLEFDGLVVSKGNRSMLLLANWGGHPCQVAFENIMGLGKPGRLRRLGGENCEWAMQSPESYRAEAFEPHAEGLESLSLGPYEILRIDFL